MQLENARSTRSTSKFLMSPSIIRFKREFGHSSNTYIIYGIYVKYIELSWNISFRYPTINSNIMGFGPGYLITDLQMVPSGRSSVWIELYLKVRPWNFLRIFKNFSAYDTDNNNDYYYDGEVNFDDVKGSFSPYMKYLKPWAIQRHEILFACITLVRFLNSLSYACGFW